MHGLDSRRGVDGAELRAAAMSFTEHGWPVVPGAGSNGAAWDGVGSLSAETAAMLLDAGASRRTGGLRWVADHWAGSRSSVLLVTGLGIDVIEVPATVGRRIAAALRSLGEIAPIAATPTGEWFFPVGGDEPLRPDVADRCDVLLHGRGSWVALPPSVFPQGAVHWRVPPQTCGWRLPRPSIVQAAIAQAVRCRIPLGGGSSVLRQLATVATGVRS